MRFKNTVTMLNRTEQNRTEQNRTSSLNFFKIYFVKIKINQSKHLLNFYPSLLDIFSICIAYRIAIFVWL